MSGDDSMAAGQSPDQDPDRNPDSGEELEPAEALEELLEEVVDGLGLEAEIEVEEADGVLRGSLRGDDVGLFIGRRGQTIDAVQHLAQRIVFREGPSPTRVVVDADGYRQRRAETLQADAEGAAEQAVRTGRPVELEADAGGGAADRPRVPARARRGGDAQRGRRARAAVGRLAARGLIDPPGPFHVNFVPGETTAPVQLGRS